MQPLPSIPPTVTYEAPRTTSTASVMTWGSSQEAVGTIEQGLLAEKENQIPRPTASTAKLITVLTVLQKKPLLPGQQGPMIEISQADVDKFNDYIAVGGSTAQVSVGEKLSEYQLIQGVMLPSANNLADTLAIWAFGSLENYKQAAQEYVEKIGAQHTTVGSDASGFSPDTVSTASDLTRIGIAAAKHPVLSEVMMQRSVDLPVAGIKNNTNWLLGEDGVIGGKTGNTDQAGGVFVFISKQQLDKGHSTTLVGAVQGEATVQRAMQQSQQLIRQASGYLAVIPFLKKGQIVAQYSAPWGETIPAVSVDNIDIATWKSKKISPKVQLYSLAAMTQTGQKVGTVLVGNKKSDIVLKGTMQQPSAQWRILR